MLIFRLIPNIDLKEASDGKSSIEFLWKFGGKFASAAMVDTPAFWSWSANPPFSLVHRGRIEWFFYNILFRRWPHFENFSFPAKMSAADQGHFSFVWKQLTISYKRPSYFMWTLLAAMIKEFEEKKATKRFLLLFSIIAGCQCRESHVSNGGGSTRPTLELNRDNILLQRRPCLFQKQLKCVDSKPEIFRRALFA